MKTQIIYSIFAVPERRFLKKIYLFGRRKISRRRRIVKEIVKHVEGVVGEASHNVDGKAGPEVVAPDLGLIDNHSAVHAHKRRVEVEDDVDEEHCKKWYSIQKHASCCVNYVHSYFAR